MNEIEICGRKLGQAHRPFVIAEIGINHEGDIEKAFRIVDDAARVGCECVKFQCHVIHDEMIPNNVIPDNATELSDTTLDVFDKQADNGSLVDMDQYIPNIFAVETVLGCDLKCPECAVGGNMISRKKGWMRFEDFKIIADKIRPYCQYLYPHIWGEPMLNKDILKIIEYSSAFTKTNISTNGNCMTKEMAERLIASGVTDIIVSIDGFTQEVYQQYRVGGNSVKSLWALSILNEFNQRNGNKVKISPQFIVFRHNQHQIQAFAEFCKTLGLKPSFKAPYIRSDSRYENSDMQKYIRPSYPDIDLLKEAMAQNCKAPKDVFTILLDGTCVACCHDHNAETNYGNIFEQDVMEIWNSHLYRKDREGILTSNAPDYCINNCLNWTLDYSVCVDNSKDRILEMV